VVGSPDYMAPEVLHGRPYDHTVDYWSLGCMLFETLVGYPPFAGKTPDETWANLGEWKKVLARPVFDKSTGDEEFNMQDSAWNFITRAITERKNRYKTMEEVMCDPYFTMFVDHYAPIDWERIRQISVNSCCSELIVAAFCA
jgi:cell cycle protein kinase DBF2